MSTAAAGLWWLSCWSANELHCEWDTSRRRVLVGALDVEKDALQASVGWPLVKLTLQQATAPVILRGSLREGRAWCRALEFADEFGISASLSGLASANDVVADNTRAISPKQLDPPPR